MNAMYSRTALVLIASIMGLAAATPHLVAGPTHFGESAVLGVGLVGGGAVQAVVAIGLVLKPSRRRMLANLLLAAVGVVAWWFVRKVGLPLGAGLWRPEAISIPDLVVPIANAIAALALAAALIRPAAASAPRWLTAAATAPFVLFALVFGGVGAAASADDTWLSLSAPVRAPEGQTVTLMYCDPNGAPLAMDLSEPSPNSVRPAPVALYLHGGGGAVGDRQAAGPGAALANQDGALFSQMRAMLLKMGFVVASIDYRLQPLYPWQDQVADAKCAVRFLRANANNLGIDPLRIGVWGSSEGGYLATMLGTATPVAGFDMGDYANQSSSVEAVIDMFGPSDFTRTSDSSGFVKAILAMTFHGDIRAERRASSVTYVAPGDPPFLIFQGADDREIPPHHSVELSQALTKAGVPNTLEIVQGAGHGLNTPGESPGPDALARQAVGFLVDQVGSKS